MYFSENNSDTDNDSEYNGISDTDSDNDDMYDAMYNSNSTHLEAEKQNHNYYLGICKYIPHENYYLSVNSISAQMFFQYPYPAVIRFLQLFSCIYLSSPQIEIMKLEIVDDVYTVIKKTFWLRIVQRTWKRIFRERQNILRQRRSLSNICCFERYGKYLHGSNSLPTLHNMLLKS
jgi:hypothetical protein